MQGLTYQGDLQAAAHRGVPTFFFLISQLESTLREKSQQLESLQEIKVNLEEQLKKETAAKVIFFVGHLIKRKKKKKKARLRM